ncbi:MAG: hypothetical protein HY552_07300 [Elusimicrobia bacterium]|nr:hypothetical protein [Elusimicrobiota bacterium]
MSLALSLALVNGGALPAFARYDAIIPPVDTAGRGAELLALEPVLPTNQATMPEIPNSSLPDMTFALGGMPPALRNFGGAAVYHAAVERAAVMSLPGLAAVPYAALIRRSMNILFKPLSPAKRERSALEGVFRGRRDFDQGPAASSRSETLEAQIGRSAAAVDLGFADRMPAARLQPSRPGRPPGTFGFLRLGNKAGYKAQDRPRSIFSPRGLNSALAAAVIVLASPVAAVAQDGKTGLSLSMPTGMLVAAGLVLLVSIFWRMVSPALRRARAVAQDSEAAGDAPARPFSSEDKPGLLSFLQGKEVHLRLRSNDLLENGRTSLTAIARGTGDFTLVEHPVFESRVYTAYPSESILTKITRRLTGRSVPNGERSDVAVIVEEKNGSLSPDDARYIEWLAREKGTTPWVIMAPELDHQSDGVHSTADSPGAEDRMFEATSFLKRQMRRLRALPAPITKDAALAAIPRTVIPIGFSLILAYVNRHAIPLERSLGYIGLAFSFAVSFALFNQTVLNYVTFCSELTRDALDRPIRALGRILSSRAGPHPLVNALLRALRFIGARGDVLIAGPSLGILCTYLTRLVLGPVGETVSVLTLLGFFQVVCNVVVGSFAGGPYNETIAHLRAVGKISNRASMYLGIVETIKMEFGRLADFGMQTLFNAIQGVLAVGFWLMLFVVDFFYPKPDVHRLKDRDEIAAVKKRFDGLRAEAGRADQR